MRIAVRAGLQAALAGALVLALPHAVRAAPDADPPRSQPDASPDRLKEALERAYELNRRALLARDADAVIAQRTEDFRAVTPDGAVHDAREMADFTRSLLQTVQQWVELSFEIQRVEPQGEEAGAEVRQHSIRVQRRADGKLHRIENWVTQRETWVATPAGWKIRRVDNIRDQRVLVDGQPR